MNTIGNPLILTEVYVDPKDNYGDYYFEKTGDPGEYVSKELAEEMLEALENLLFDFEEEISSVDPDYWKLGDEGSWTTNILKTRELILKAKGE